MQGAAARALAKRALSLASVSPRYLIVKSARQQDSFGAQLLVVLLTTTVTTPSTMTTATNDSNENDYNREDKNDNDDNNTS